MDRNVCWSLLEYLHNITFILLRSVYFQLQYKQLWNSMPFFPSAITLPKLILKYSCLKKHILYIKIEKVMSINESFENKWKPNLKEILSSKFVSRMKMYWFSLFADRSMNSNAIYSVRYLKYVYVTFQAFTHLPP